MVPLTLEMGKKARSLSLYTLGLIFITDLCTGVYISR